MRDVDLFVRWYGGRAYAVHPALRGLLALPFEHALVAHGEPVHPRSEFVAALDREPWS